MVDKELKEEVNDKLITLFKGMTPKERSEYTAEIFQLSVMMSITDALPDSLKETLKKNEGKVA